MFSIEMKKAEQRFNMKKAIYALIIGMFYFFVWGCRFSFGTIIITESEAQDEFLIKLNDYNDRKECRITLGKGESIQIEIETKKGTVSLDMVGKKGSNPYSGNKLENIRFMVAVTEADVYTFNVKGNKATGTIKIKKIS